MNSLLTELVKEILDNIPNEDKQTGHLSKLTKSALKKDHRVLFNGENDVLQKIQRLLYSQLEDQESKIILIKVLAYRLLGGRVSLPLSSEKHQKIAAHLESFVSDDVLDIDFSVPMKLGKTFLKDIPEINRDIKLFITGGGIETIFYLEQYKYDKEGVFIGVKNGDVVLDCGGCWGDTALYFADEVGETGKVFTFEFLDDNLEILKKNLLLSPKLSKRIHLVDKPVWSESGVTMGLKGKGPGTSVNIIPSGQEQNYKKTVQTISIDDLIKQKQFSQLDFIKMDIEGAEVEALQGTREAILKYKPDLAISIYHDIRHFFQIPKYIKSLVPEYKFYLDHYTPMKWETVLYASVK